MPASSSASASLPTFPSPSLHSKDADEDEVLQNMFSRMASHTTTSSSAPRAANDSEEENSEEEWHDASDGDEELLANKEEEDLSVEELEERLSKADVLKTQANSLFTAKSYHQAIQTYHSALATLPPRPTPTPPTSASPPEDSSSPPTSPPSPSLPLPSSKARPSREKPPPTPPSSSFLGDAGPRIEEITDLEADLITRGETPLEKERRECLERVRQLRSVCWGNVGACWLRMEQWKEAVDACSEALLDSARYVKALHRRSTANIALDTWASLTSAQEDLQTLLPLLSPSDPLYSPTNLHLRTLPAKIKAKQDKEKDEMLGKLKELGNGLLGRFGMSTDNFKFEPNGEGGYSMQFVNS